MSEDRKNMKEQSEPELEKVTKRLNEYLKICPPDQKAAAQAKKRWKQIGLYLVLGNWRMPSPRLRE